jgi:hypothetical protein
MDTFFKVIEVIDVFVFLVGIAVAVYAVAKGVLPVLWRLGAGLAHRKIAVFATGANAVSLRALLLDSKLIKAENIIEVPSLRDIESADPASVYLVFWRDWADNIDEILRKKPDQCALIVYSPLDDNKQIPPDQMKKLDGKRHTAVTNFRGRLLNDIVSSMITTSYEKS